MTASASGVLKSASMASVNASTRRLVQRTVSVERLGARAHGAIGPARCARPRCRARSTGRRRLRSRTSATSDSAWPAGSSAPRSDRSASRIDASVVKFSSECAILSPPASTTRPACAQWRANGTLPVSDSLCAISFSWCGKIRSRAAAVDVDLVAERLARPSPSTRCASPAGPRPHGLGQRRLALARVLPEREVARVALARLELLAGGHELAVQVAVAELAVLAETRRRRSTRRRFGRVGVAGLDQARR